MRGARAYWILGVFLSFLSLVMVGFYIGWRMNVDSSGTGFSQASQASGWMFMSIVVTQSFLVLFITPALTSGAITVEKEQRTIEMLDLTPLPRRAIIIGKLLSAVAFTGLLILSSLPLVSICFMLGSVDPTQILQWYLLLLLGSFFVGSIGLMWSSIAKNTTYSIILTYITLFGPFLGVFFVGTSMTFWRMGGTDNLGFSMLGAFAMPWASDTLLGIKLTGGISAVVLFGLAGVLLSSIARVRLEMIPERKGWITRGILVGTLLFLLYTIDSWWLANYYHLLPPTQQVPLSSGRPTVLLLNGLIILMFLIPIFTTGDLKPYEIRRYFGQILSGLTLRGIKRGKPTTGVSYLALLTAIILGMYMLCFVFIGKGKEINGDFGRTHVVTPPMPVKTPPVPIVQNGGVKTPPAPSAPVLDPLEVRAGSPAYLASIGGLPQIAIVLFTFVIGYSLFTLLLSLLFRSKWPAMALSYIGLLAIWLVPTTGGYQTVGTTVKVAPQVYGMLLNPYLAIHQINDPNDFLHYDQLLAFRNHIVWGETTLAWAIIGLLSLACAVPLVNREKRKGREILFEDLVAEA